MPTVAAPSAAVAATTVPPEQDREKSEKIGKVKGQMVELTMDYGVPQLEKLYARLLRSAFASRSSGEASGEDLTSSLLGFLCEFVEHPSNF